MSITTVSPAIRKFGKRNRRCFAALSMTVGLGLIGADRRLSGNWAFLEAEISKEQPQIPHCVSG